MKERDFTAGQYLPENTQLHSMDPRLKIAAALFLSIIVFFYNGKQLAIFASALVISIIALKLPLGEMLLSIRTVWVIVVITALLQFFLTPGRVLFTLGFLTVTDSGLYNGILFSSRIILLVIVLSSLIMSTSPIRIADAIESLFKPISSISPSVYSLSTIVSIVLTFVPGTLRRTKELMKAQMSRGAEFKTRNFVKMVDSVMPVIIPLFIKSFRDAEELYCAMEARAYSPGMRTHLKPMKIKSSELILSLFFAACAIALKFLI